MTSTFNINKHYSVDISLNTNENNIYILIVNKISHRSYETIIRPSDIMNIVLNIHSIHQIIVKSFDSENDDYTFNMNFTGNSLKLSFDALFDKFLKINFDVFLAEKKISSDEELSYNFNKMEIKLRELEETIAQQQNHFEEKITQQQNQIISLENNLSNGVISLIHNTFNGYQYAFNFMIPLNLTELDLSENDCFRGYNNMFPYLDYEKIAYL